MTSGDHESFFAPGAPPPGPSVVAWNVSGTPPLREGPGMRIGPYTIVRQIGEGGFGAVFLAEQLEPVKRTVALKILKLGMDTREVVARFEQERQALALMDHPNIARVIDAGATETGRPYFVMDFVEGLPIAQYCDEAHLSVDARLELFAQVCDAVQHAHGKGIIHRDLKPSNILVAVREGKPGAKIIDFGIAKAVAQKLTDKTVFTEDRQVIGTLQYMSPEQAAGSLDIDTRTDVYALGVVLYELLTGSTPFDARALRAAMFDEVQRMIREVDPPRPSTRLRQSSDTIASIAALRRVEPKRLGSIVRGELDWIVMKALEKERGRRYATAAGFAEDLRRYLGGEAVVAAPPSAVYRARKFVRKNRVAVGAATAVLVSLVAGVVAFASQARIARRERDRAVSAEAETRRERDRAVAAEGDSKRERDRALAAEADTRRERDRAVGAEAETKKRAEELSLVSDFQAKMLEKIDVPRTGADLAQSLRTKQVAALAESGVPEPDRAPRTQTFTEELARVNATDAAMGVIDGAILNPAVEAVGKQFEDQPLVAAKLQQTLANLYKRFGKYEQALPLQESAQQTRRKELGIDHPDTLLSINNTATLLDRQGQYARAEPLYREALDGWRRVRGAESQEVQIQMTNLAGNLRFQGKHAEAEPMLRESFELGKRVWGEDARQTLVCENILGYTLIDQGRLAETEPLWRDSYERGKKALGPEDPDVLTWANNLGSVLRSMGRLAEAETYFREAYEGYRRTRGEAHPSTLSCAYNVAQLLWKLKRFEDAESLARKTLEAQRGVLGPEHLNTLQTMRLLGGSLRDAGKLSEAEPYLLECLETSRRVLGPQHLETLRCAMNVAQLLEMTGKTEEAGRMYVELLDTPKAVWKDENPDRLLVMNYLGLLLLGTGRASDAEEMLREALSTRVRVSGPEHAETLVVQNSLGKALEKQRKLPEAEALFRDTLEKSRKSFGAEHPDTAIAMANVGGVLAAQAKFEEAEKELLEAQRVLAAAQGVSARVIAGNRKALLELYTEWEKAEPGKGHGERALEWQ